MKKYKLLIVFCLCPAFLFAQVNDSLKREIKIPGVVNFRDLGGYKTVDNKHTKWHTIYRSAALNGLNQAGFDTLERRNVSTVVDFRSTDEVKKAKDNLPTTIHYLHCPQGSENMNAGLMRDINKYSTGDTIMVSFYNRLDSIKVRTQLFFKELLDLPAHSALVFHCTAGKDRTGMAAALFLSALGVPKETIMQDYLASNYYRKDVNKKSAKEMEKYMHLKPQVAEDLMSVKPAYLEATFQEIDKQYGNVHNYLKKSIGLKNSDLKKLKRKYTE